MTTKKEVRHYYKCLICWSRFSVSAEQEVFRCPGKDDEGKRCMSLVHMREEDDE